MPRRPLVPTLLCLTLALAAAAGAAEVEKFHVRQQFGPVQPRGQAQVNDPPGADQPLVVSNIGSSGQDGIDFDVGETAGAIGPIRWLAPEALRGRRTTFVVHALDAAGQPVSYEVETGFGGDLDENGVTANPLATGGTVVVATVHDGGDPVYAEQVQISLDPIFTSSAPPIGCGAGLDEDPYQPFDLGDFTFFYGDGTVFTLPGQPAGVTGDRVTLRLRPEGVAGKALLTGLSVLGTEPPGSVGEMTFTSLPATFFGHTVGVLGLATAEGDDVLPSRQDAKVVISILPGSASDGFDVALGENDRGLAVALDAALTHPPDPGSVMTVAAATTQADDGSAAPLPVVHCRYASSFFDVWTELSASGPPVSVEFLLDGEVIGTAADPTAVAQLLVPPTASVQYPFKLGCTATDTGGLQTCLTWAAPLIYRDDTGIDEDCDGICMTYDPGSWSAFYRFDNLEIRHATGGGGDLVVVGFPNVVSLDGAPPLEAVGSEALGEADLMLGPDGELVVSNIGSSGEDGVIVITNTGGSGSDVDSAWETCSGGSLCMDPDPGHSFELSFRDGYGGGGSGGVIVIVARGAGTEFVVGNDFSGLGTGDVLWNFYEGGALVGSTVCGGNSDTCFGCDGIPSGVRTMLTNQDATPRVQLLFPPGTGVRIPDPAGGPDVLATADLIEGEPLDTVVTPFTDVTDPTFRMAGLDGPLVITSLVSGIFTSAPDAVAAPRAVLHGPQPNPANPRTTVAFDLPRDERVVLEVVDLRGRRVRELVRGMRPAGEMRVAWDGRDDAGREVASGTYVFRLNAGGEVRTRKGALVR